MTLYTYTHVTLCIALHMIMVMCIYVHIIYMCIQCSALSFVCVCVYVCVGVYNLIHIHIVLCVWFSVSAIFRLVGDVLLASGFLSYCGPFNQDFRSQLLLTWKKELSSRKIPFSQQLNLLDMLSDATTIGEWNLQGLPNDELSTQNGIIVTKATRFPLLIDPQVSL